MKEKSELERRLRVAFSAAEKAGRVLKKNFRKKQEIAFKGTIDLVTESDKKAEEIIIKEIAQAFPQEGILSEEKGGKVEKSHLWLIDPLDGTTNYAHGIPFYAVSIAYLQEGQLKLALVYNPQQEEWFHSLRGEGAFLNKKLLQVSSRTNLDHCLVATGFPYDVRSHLENNLSYFIQAQLHTRGVRRLGAASLDLAYVAAGIFDAYWELRLKPWDVAAGALLVLEAGGKITTMNGAPFSPFARSYLATNGFIHRAFQKVLAEGRKISFTKMSLSASC